MKKTMDNMKVIFLLIAIAVIFLIGGFITGNVISENPSVYFSQEIMDMLNNEFNSNPSETVICLTGSKELFNYNIDGYFKPEIINSDGKSIKYESCGANNENEDVIATWHNHIDSACVLSDSDLFSFGGDYFAYLIELQIVQCGTDNIGIFDKDAIYRQERLSEKDSLKYAIK